MSTFCYKHTRVAMILMFSLPLSSTNSKETWEKGISNLPWILTLTSKRKLELLWHQSTLVSNLRNLLWGMLHTMLRQLYFSMELTFWASTISSAFYHKSANFTLHLLTDWFKWVILAWEWPTQIKMRLDWFFYLWLVRVRVTSNGVRNSLVLNGLKFCLILFWESRESCLSVMHITMKYFLSCKEAENISNFGQRYQPWSLIWLRNINWQKITARWGRILKSSLILRNFWRTTYTFPALIYPFLLT